MWRKGHGNFNPSAFFHGTIKIKEYAASADILRLGQEFVSLTASQPHCSGQSHIETSHRAAFLSLLNHVLFPSFEHRTNQFLALQCRPDRARMPVADTS